MHEHNIGLPVESAPQPNAPRSSVSVQMDLILNENIILDEITDFAPQFFPATVASQNISTVDMDCHHILAACVDSDLNPFPRGVNLTLRYGEYLDVSPSALTSFYTNSFLGEMAQCTSKGICLDDVPEALQVNFYPPQL